MGSIQHMILQLLEAAGPLPVRAIAARLELSVGRVAASMFSAAQRGHVARHEREDGAKPVFAITRAGITALTVLDCLQQRLDEKLHAPRRAPQPEETANKQGVRQVMPFIEPKFALAMARLLHKSSLSISQQMRERIRNIVEKAA